jgi:hypothetical protein
MAFPRGPGGYLSQTQFFSVAELADQLRPTSDLKAWLYEALRFAEPRQSGKQFVHRWGSTATTYGETISGGMIGVFETLDGRLTFA